MQSADAGSKKLFSVMMSTTSSRSTGGGYFAAATDEQHHQHDDDHVDHGGDGQPNDDKVNKGGKDDELEPPVDQQPRFTQDDERRELASLTIDDIYKIQADLMGIETIAGRLSGLGLGGSAPNCNISSPQHSSTARTMSPKEQELLLSLEIELNKIPASKKAAYSQATMKCPDEVSDIKRLAFVEREEGDVSKAALRLVKYWAFRLELFGHDRCYLSMTLLGAMQDEMMNLAERMVWQLLPNTDAAGRGILHFAASNRDLSQNRMKEEFRAFFYFAHCHMEDDRTRRKGFVQMVDGRHIVRQHFTREYPKYIAMFEESFPIQMRAVHLCYPNDILFYIIYPVLRRLVPKNIRLRVKMHHGSTSEVLRSLAEFSLPPERVHKDLGGSAKVDMNEFLMNRMKIEAASLGLKFSSSLCDHTSGEIDDDNDGGSDAKRRKSVSPPTSVSHPIANRMPANMHAKSQLTSANRNREDQSSGKSQAAKRSGPRNVVDPRMARAVQFKKANPDRPLLDALEAGGFIFVTQAGERANDSTRIDEQGVSLKQVRNISSVCSAVCLGKS